MNTIKDFLSEVRDYAIDKYELKDTLRNIIEDKYNGDYSSFMNNEILNEDYGSLRTIIGELYMD